MTCDAGAHARTKEYLIDDHAIAEDKRRAWLVFFELSKPDVSGRKPDHKDGLLILGHPPYQPPRRSYIIYQPHVPTNTGTAAYADVIKLLDQVLNYMGALQICVFLLGGDQQTFSRMLWLRRFDQTDKYSQIVPFVGDFHGAVHMLMSIHIIW